MPQYAQKYTALGENGGGGSAYIDDDFRQVGESIKNSNWPEICLHFYDYFRNPTLTVPTPSYFNGTIGEP